MSVSEAKDDSRSLLRIQDLTDAVVDTHQVHSCLAVGGLRRCRTHLLTQGRELATELRLGVFRQRVRAGATAATATSPGSRGSRTGRRTMEG